MLLECWCGLNSCSQVFYLAMPSMSWHYAYEIVVEYCSRPECCWCLLTTGQRDGMVSCQAGRIAWVETVYSSQNWTFICVSCRADRNWAGSLKISSSLATLAGSELAIIPNTISVQSFGSKGSSNYCRLPGCWPERQPLAFLTIAGPFLQIQYWWHSSRSFS